MKRTWINQFKKNDLKQVKVTGALSPIEWDEKGNATKFSIYSYENEEDIIIEHHKSNKKLRRLLNKNVEAIGRLRLNESGEKFIRLNKIKKVSEQEPIVSQMFKPKDYGLWNEEFSLSIPNDYNFQGGFYE